VFLSVVDIPLQPPRPSSTATATALTENLCIVFIGIPLTNFSYEAVDKSAPAATPPAQNSSIEMPAIDTAGRGMFLGGEDEGSIPSFL
jgi:hypothetical protein